MASNKSYLHFIRTETGAHAQAERLHYYQHLQQQSVWVLLRQDQADPKVT